MPRLMLVIGIGGNQGADSPAAVVDADRSTASRNGFRLVCSEQSDESLFIAPGPSCFRPVAFIATFRACKWGRRANGGGGDE